MPNYDKSNYSVKAGKDRMTLGQAIFNIGWFGFIIACAIIAVFGG